MYESIDITWGGTGFVKFPSCKFPGKKAIVCELPRKNRYVN